MIGPETRLQQVKDRTRYVRHLFLFSLKTPQTGLVSRPLKNRFEKSGSDNRKWRSKPEKRSGQIKDQSLISNFEKMSTPLSLSGVLAK